MSANADVLVSLPSVSSPQHQERGPPAPSSRDVLYVKFMSPSQKGWKEIECKKRQREGLRPPLRSSKRTRYSLSQAGSLSEDGLLKIHPCPTPEIQALYDQNAGLPFFQLPSEIRIKIYSHLLGGLYIDVRYEETVILTGPNQPAKATRTPRPRKKLPGYVFGGFWHNCYVLDDSICYGGSFGTEHIGGQIMPCLKLISRTCRQIYAETVLLPYELNTFAIGGFSPTLTDWVTELPVGSSQCIESLDLQPGRWWQRLQRKTFRQLRGLKRVRVRGEWIDVEVFREGKRW